MSFAMFSLVRDNTAVLSDLLFKEVNPAFEHLIGFPREQLVGHTVSRLNRNFQPAWNAVFQQIILQKNDSKTDLDLYLPENDCWLAVKLFYIDADTLVTLLVDVTAHKGRAEELEHFFQVNLDMFSIADGHGNFIKLNKKWEHVLGYTIQELEEKNYLELIHPDDLEKTRNVLVDLEQQKEVVNFVNRYRARNGEYHFIEWQCMPNGPLIFSSSRDITERLMVSQKLAYNEQLYRGLLESQNDIIVRIDKDFCFTYVNDVFCSTYGTNREELIGAHMFSKIAKKDQSQAFNMFQQLKQPPHRLQVVEHSPTFTGLRWISWAFSAIFDDKHQLIEVLAVGRDINDIKLQEEKIESQEKFRQIVDNIGGIFWLLSADKKDVLFVSSNFKRVHGKDYVYTNDPIEPLRSIVYPPDREKFELAVSRFMETGQFEEEFRVINPDEQIHWITSSAFPVLDDKGKIQSYAGLFQDITERKNIETSEAEKTNRLNAIIEAMPDLMFIITVDGYYVDVVSSDPTSLATSPDEIIGKNIRDFFPDEADILLRLFRESIEQKKVVTGTYNLRNDGELMHFEARITPLGVDKILSVVRNVTELYTANERLRFQTGLQKLLVQISNTYINLPAGQLEATINASIKELGEFIGADRFYVFEYSKDTHVFNNTHEWCSPGVEPQIEYLQNAPADDFQIFLDVHRKGEILHLHDVAAMPADDPVRLALEVQDIKSMIAVPLLDGDEYVGFVGIDSVQTKKLFDDDEQQLLKVYAQTLTSARQRIRSQQELEEALIKSKESDRLKSAFLATVSHELRTPLNHILGFSELIKMVATDDSIRDYARDINTSGQGLLEMIEDVFSIALAEKGSVVLRPVSMKGVELFMASKNILQEMLSNSGKNETIQLRFNPGPELMGQLFVSDRQKIQQVLSNLFSNAVKFTVNGSIEFGMYRVDETVEFYVRDSGIGISPDNHQYLFELFRQLDDSYSRHFEGLGIGLSIARKLADILGASIRVESELGEGSCFYFKVPVEFV